MLQVLEGDILVYMERRLVLTMSQTEPTLHFTVLTRRRGRIQGETGETIQ